MKHENTDFSDKHENLHAQRYTKELILSAVETQGHQQTLHTGHVVR